MTKIIMDFETRSAADIRTVGTWNYSKHPTTDVMCLAFQVVSQDDSHPWIWWPSQFDQAILDVDPALIARKATLDFFYRMLDGAEEVEAHNKFFEECIWQHVMVPRYGAPPIHTDKWRCSMAKAAAAGWPLALKDVSKAMHLPEQKDDEGHKIMQRVSKPRKRHADGTFDWWEDGERLSKLFRYCIQDVVTEKAVSDGLPELDPTEFEVWQLDQKMNKRGVYVDTEMCVAAEQADGELQDELNEELEIITDGAVTKGSQVQKMMKWLQSVGCQIADLTKDTLEWLLASPYSFQVIGSAHRLCEIRQQASRASVKKYTAMKLQADPDDQRIRDVCRYCGAHTGRWSSTGVQTQNMIADRAGWLHDKDYDCLCEAVAVGSLQWLRLLYGEDSSTAMALATRGAIRAAPGNDLLVSDFSSVEARGLLWLARDPNLARIFKGEDLYKFMAGRIFGVDPSQIQKGTMERFTGKTAVLGLGYGMGAPKFVDTCLVQGGVTISLELAKRAVTAYRETFYAVPQLWDACNAAAINAVRYWGREFNVNGLIQFYASEEFGQRYLNVRLPSGRILRYPNPHVGMRTPPWDNAQPRPALFYWGYQQTGKGGRVWCEQDTYGGKICENVVQAICRDLMAWSMLRAEANAYPPVMTVHDELVCEVPKGIGSARGLEEIMSEAPPWAEGMPIAAEGWRGERYRK